MEKSPRGLKGEGLYEAQAQGQLRQAGSLRGAESQGAAREFAGEGREGRARAPSCSSILSHSSSTK